MTNQISSKNLESLVESLKRLEEPLLEPVEKPDHQIRAFRGHTIGSLIAELTNLAEDHNIETGYVDGIGNGYDQGVFIDVWKGRKYQGLTNRFDMSWDITGMGLTLNPKE